MCDISIGCNSLTDAVMDGPQCWTIQIWFSDQRQPAERHLLASTEISGDTGVGSLNVEAFFANDEPVLAELQIIASRALLGDVDWPAVHIEVEQALQASIPGLGHSLPAAIERLFDADFLTEAARVLAQIDSSLSAEDMSTIAKPLLDDLRKAEA